VVWPNAKHRLFKQSLLTDLICCLSRSDAAVVLSCDKTVHTLRTLKYCDCLYYVSRCFTNFSSLRLFFIPFFVYQFSKFDVTLRHVAIDAVVLGNIALLLGLFVIYSRGLCSC
jgi:hypothetical protein